MEASNAVTDTVEELIQLQELDEAIGSDAAELVRLNAELLAMDEEIEGRQAGAASAREELGAAEERVRRHERTAQAARATYKSLQQRASGVQNMRQHLAARAEVEAARRNLDTAEEAALEAIQVAERLTSRATEAEADLEELESAHAARRAEIEARLGELEDQLTVSRDRRENRALRIDERTRRLYDKVRGGRTREALAPIVDGVCGHCFTSIPLQRQAVIRAGRDLVVCETCGVILHAPRDREDNGR